MVDSDMQCLPASLSCPLKILVQWRAPRSVRCHPRWWGAPRSVSLALSDAILDGFGSPLSSIHTTSRASCRPLVASSPATLCCPPERHGRSCTARPSARRERERRGDDCRWSRTLKAPGDAIPTSADDILRIADRSFLYFLGQVVLRPPALSALFGKSGDRHSRTSTVTHTLALAPPSTRTPRVPGGS